MEKRGHTTTAVQQMVASCSGAVLTALFVTPLDVVKIRLQKQVKHRQVGYSKGVEKSLSFLSKKMTPLDVVKVRLQSQKRGPLTPGRCFIYSNGLMDHLCTCVHPIDNTKVDSCHVPWYNRPSKFTGTLDAMLHIARREGIRSLWSGLSPTLVMAVPATVCYFTMYDQLFAMLSSRLETRRPGIDRLTTAMLAGSIARVTAVTLISPMEMIRTKVQSERISYLDVAKAIRGMVRRHGWHSMWLGLTPTLMRDVPFSAIYWASYESAKTFWLQRLQKAETTFSVSFVSGFFAGALAAVVTCPFDVIKTHRQIELGEHLAIGARLSPSTWQLLKRLYQQQRLRGLFAGLTPRVIKIAPACAIMIGTYEYGKLFFKNYNDRNRTTSSAVDC